MLCLVSVTRAQISPQKIWDVGSIQQLHVGKVQEVKKNGDCASMGQTDPRGFATETLSQMVQPDYVKPLSQHFITGVQVAGLHLLFEHNSTRDLDLGLSSSHQQFILNDLAEVDKTPAFSDTLVLQMHQDDLDRKSAWEKSICVTKIWELWKDAAGHFVFYNPLQPLLRQVIVDPDFNHGLLIGNFELGTKLVRPLSQDLEIVLFSNWLAKFGDVILHAAGFTYEGKGYVFAGDAGIGKSTLAAHFSNNPAFTILGEDQVILRLKEGRFWVYGTPWHINPQMCSSGGAPLEGLFFLEKDCSNRIKPVTSIEGVKRLLQTAFIPYYRLDALPAILDRLVLLSENIQFMSLSYKLGTNVWSLIKPNQPDSD